MASSAPCPLKVCVLGSLPTPQTRQIDVDVCFYRETGIYGEDVEKLEKEYEKKSIVRKCVDANRTLGDKGDIEIILDASSSGWTVQENTRVILSTELNSETKCCGRTFCLVKFGVLTDLVGVVTVKRLKETLILPFAMAIQSGEGNNDLSSGRGVEDDEDDVVAEFADLRRPVQVDGGVKDKSRRRPRAERESGYDSVHSGNFDLLSWRL